VRAALAPLGRHGRMVIPAFARWRLTAGNLQYAATGSSCACQVPRQATRGRQGTRNRISRYLRPAVFGKGRVVESFHSFRKLPHAALTPTTCGTHACCESRAGSAARRDAGDPWRSAKSRERVCRRLGLPAASPNRRASGEGLRGRAEPDELGSASWVFTRLINQRSSSSRQASRRHGAG
jgi:hypothetical protein